MMREDELTPQERELGEALGRLPRPIPPADLTARTVARVRAEGSRQPGSAEPKAPTRVWWQRPITSPIARAAAAIVLVAALVLVTAPRTSERIGVFFSHLLGERNTEKLDLFVDRVLIAIGPANIQPENPHPPRAPRANGPHTTAPGASARV
ncbi:MAG: hypothetical protein M5U26_02195 [Planctomycetota bacterium]|nr:hypothetical protein [Planctomycetota bacterium]